MKCVLKAIFIMLVVFTNSLICQTGSECWTQKPDILTGRIYIYPAFYSNKIYAIGGGLSASGGNYPSHSNIVEEYDLNTNTWQKKSNIPSGTGGYIVQMNDRIFVFGRNKNGAAEEYLPASDTWQTISGTPKFSWTGLPVCEMIAFQNKVYAFSFNQGTTPGNISVFDPSTSKWTTVGRLKTARSWFRLAVVKDKIYVIGGNFNGIPTETSLRTIEEYNPQSNEWTSKKSLEIIRHEIAVTTFNDKIYVIAGHDRDGILLNNVVEYDPDKQESINKTNLPYKVWGASAITVNNKIYIFGGGEEDCTNKFYEYDPALDNTTDVKSEGKEGRIFKLFQNYPNPFNPSTTIQYTIPEIPLSRGLSPWEDERGMSVTLKVYDILGNEVATLVNEEQAPGIYKIRFDVSSYGGSNLSSGVYLYELKTSGFIQNKKMILIK